MSAPSGWIVRDGLRLALHDTGGAGVPVLFQHGLCGDAGQTAEAFPHMPGYRRVTLECRGHGASDTGPDLSIATFTDDAIAVAQSLPGPVVAGGISMGAAIALRLAVHRPDLVRSLILVRPAWGCGRAPANMRPVAEVGALMSAMSPAVALARFVAGSTARRLAGTSPDNLASLRGFFGRAPAQDTARLLCALAADGPRVTMADLAALRLPVLVCGSAEDTIHPAALARRLARLIPGARHVDLPPKGRGRPPHFAALHAAIRDFLKET